MRPMRAWAFIVAWALAAPAWAQPTVGTDPAPMGVEETIARVRSAYRDGPTAERVVVRVTARSGRSSGSRVAVRLSGGESPSVRLDLGDLQVFAGEGVIRAAHRAESRLYAEWPLDGPLDLARLSRRLPPILLPQLSIALGNDPSLSRPFAPLPSVLWERVEAGNRTGAAGRVTLHGSGPGIRARLTLDVRTGRLWRAVAELDEPADVARVELHCTPLDPGDPASWRIPTLDRERVEDLTLLRPRPAEINPGDPVGDLRLFDADLARWSPPPDARAVVLLAFRRSNGMAGGADTQADVEAGLLALAPLAREWNQTIPGGLGCRAVAVYDADAFDRESFAALDALWSPAVSLATDGIRAETGYVLWSGGGARWMARFRPGYHSALIVLKPGEGGLILAAAIPLDGRSEDPEGITEELRAALTGPG